MASIFCYAEHLGGVSYRFFIGGTNENYRDANAIKVMGTSWSTNNAFVTTLLGITGYLDGKHYKGRYKELGVNMEQVRYSKNEEEKHKRGSFNVLKVPSFNVKIKRNGEILFDKTYTMNIGSRDNAGIVEYWIDPLTIDTNFNIYSTIGLNS